MDNSEVVVEEKSYDEKVANCSVIAKPMATKKLAKKCYKLIKKGNILWTIECIIINKCFFS